MATVHVLYVLLVFLYMVSVLVCPSASADPVLENATVTDSLGNIADSDSKITWSPLTTGQSYKAGSPARISQSLEPYYNLVHSFINSVFAAGIPYEIANKALTNDLGDVMSNYSNYTSYFVGYAICVAIGVLFLAIFPIVACCVCCCRCCCKNCGGRNIQPKKEATNQLRKYAFSLVLFILIAFLFAGAACIYVNNSNTSTALNQISTDTKNNLDDVRTYMNNTQQQIVHLGRDYFNFMKIVIFRDFDNIAYFVGLPIRQDIESGTDIRTTLATVLTLETDITNIDTSLTNIETKTAALTTSINSLSTSLSDVRTNLNNIQSSCSCTLPDFSGADVNVNTNNFPIMTAPRSSIDAAKGINLTAKVIEAEQELDSIPDRVKTDSQTTVNSLKGTINGLSDSIDPMINQVTDMNKMVSGENATIDLDGISEQVEKLGDVLKTYDKYRWYGGVALASVVLLITVLALLGLLLGTMASCASSSPPHKRGTISQAGGCCLTVSAVLVFLIADLLMLLTVLPFMLGAPMHRFMCQPLTDLEELEKIIQLYNDHDVGAGKYFLGKMLLNNDTIPLTVTGMLRDCQNGKSVYEAFKLSSKFNIDSLLDYTSTLDVQTEIDSVNVDLSSISIYNTDLKNQLQDIKDAVNISFSSFYTEMSNSPAGADLSALATQLESVGAGAPYQGQLDTQAAELRRIESEEYAYVQGNITALNTSVAAMEAAVSGLPTTITNLDNSLLAADAYVQANGSDVVRNRLNEYVNRLLGIVNSYTGFALSSVKTNVGQCQPVWNIYNTLLIYTFCYNIMDCFNGFWFSLGWCIFFFLPSIIFSMKLAKYFKKMDRDPNGSSHSLASMNKVHPAPGSVINPYDFPNQKAGTRQGNKNKIHPSLDDW